MNGNRWQFMSAPCPTDTTFTPCEKVSGDNPTENAKPGGLATGG